MLKFQYLIAESIVCNKGLKIELVFRCDCKNNLLNTMQPVGRILESDACSQNKIAAYVRPSGQMSDSRPYGCDSFLFLY